MTPNAKRQTQKNAPQTGVANLLISHEKRDGNCSKWSTKKRTKNEMNQIGNTQPVEHLLMTTTEQLALAAHSCDTFKPNPDGIIPEGTRF